MDKMINIPTQANVVSENPQSQVRLYSGVPWDNRYEHVRLYASQSALLTALEHWRVNTINQMTPIRVGELTVKVPFEEMSMLEINYLTFQNTGISSEWVFCFVTSIEWQSRNSTIIRFQLDIWQNNIYKATLKPSFVSQGHIPKSQDTLFSNLYPVNVESGENYCCQQSVSVFPPEYICAYKSQEADETSTTEGAIVNNVYRAASLTYSDSADTINSLIDQYTQAGIPDAIIALFQAPRLCINAETNPGAEEENITVEWNASNFFEGYTPRNNKLYTYPFIYLLVNNNEGTINQYKFEYSDNSNHNLTFSAIGCLCTTPQIILLPTQYNGYAIAYNDSMTLSNFPICAWNSDTYKAWLAQNKNVLSLTEEVAREDATYALAGALFNTAGSLAMGDVTGVGEAWRNFAGQYKSSYRTIQSLMAQKADKAILPPNNHGQALNDSINTARNLNSFNFYQMSIREEYARRIDDYFDLYGYPIMEIQNINLSSRSSWNFIKTENIQIQGAIDLDQRAQLCAIFDNGVTVWHTDDIGNYSLSNN